MKVVQWIVDWGWVVVAADLSAVILLLIWPGALEWTVRSIMACGLLAVIWLCADMILCLWRASQNRGENSPAATGNGKTA